MAVVLALVAAVLFALATVLQQRAGMDDGAEGSASGLLLRMARRPVWLGGVLADALGYVAQAVAISAGRLAIVQPVLVSTVVFALPLGARITHQRVRAVDVGAALLVTAGLVVFLVAANPSGGRDNAPAGEWLVAGGAIAILTVPLALIARAVGPARKAALLGAAAGMLFGLTAALTKAVTDRLGDGVLELVVNWEVYALIVVGYVAMTFNQLALSTGVLAPAVATGLALNRSPASSSVPPCSRSRSTRRRSGSWPPCWRSPPRSREWSSSPAPRAGPPPDYIRRSHPGPPPARSRAQRRGSKTVGTARRRERRQAISL